MKTINKLLIIFIFFIFILSACTEVEGVIIAKNQAHHKIKSDRFYITYKEVSSGKRFTTEVSEYMYFSTEIGDTVKLLY